MGEWGEVAKKGRGALERRKEDGVVHSRPSPFRALPGAPSYLRDLVEEPFMPSP
jgi:hypothetical protein